MRGAIVRIRPEAQEKLREGFQRKAERQRRLYAGHLADGQARFISLTYRNMLDPYPALGREMRALAPADLAATWPKLPLIKEIILAHAGHPDPAGEER